MENIEYAGMSKIKEGTFKGKSVYYRLFLEAPVDEDKKYEAIDLLLVGFPYEIFHIDMKDVEEKTTILSVEVVCDSKGTPIEYLR